MKDITEFYGLTFIPARPTTYKKGPDVMSKSLRTQRRYREANRGQTKLNFLPAGLAPQSSAATSSESAPIPFNTDLQLPTIPLSRSASVLSSPSEDSDDNNGYRSGENSQDRVDQSLGLKEDEWEDELEERIQGQPLDGAATVRSWEDLREKVKEDMQEKNLPLRKINQLLVIRNFATLQIKGSSRITASLEIAQQWHEGKGDWYARRVRALARHYQIFERLPIEKRGGSLNARSWLHDEVVQAHSHAWLNAQPIGKVTPRRFAQAVHTTIFPDLNITPKFPICERTARRWLIKLGWRRTLVRKGVYMDGHEREDVVAYRVEIFLPTMELYEHRMAKYELKGPDLVRVPPTLGPGERELIAYFHDECCFHANDEANSLWLVHKVVG